MKNSVNLIGRVGKDIRLKSLKDNKTVAEFTLVTEDFFRDNDEIKKSIEWHRLELWNKQKLAALLTTGMLLDIEGSIHTSSFSKTIGGEAVTFYNTVIRVERILILSRKES